jgi:hypothetical protein
MLRQSHFLGSHRPITLTLGGGFLTYDGVLEDFRRRLVWLVGFFFLAFSSRLFASTLTCAGTVGCLFISCTRYFGAL